MVKAQLKTSRMYFTKPHKETTTATTIISNTICSKDFQRLMHHLERDNEVIVVNTLPMKSD